MLDKNEILLAHTIPTGANPDTVKADPTPNPTVPINFSETIVNFFYLSSYSSFCNIHYEL